MDPGTQQAAEPQFSQNESKSTNHYIKDDREPTLPPQKNLNVVEPTVKNEVRGIGLENRLSSGTPLGAHDQHLDLLVDKLLAAFDAREAQKTSTQPPQQPLVNNGRNEEISDEPLLNVTGPESPPQEPKKKKKRTKLPIPWVKILTFEDSSTSDRKKIEFAVDAFNYQMNDSIKHYFLTHFHSDHYFGITKKWNNGLIYCTDVTAKLLSLKIKINEEILVPMKLNVTYELIDNIFMTWIDANHCPGAAIILFEYVKEIPQSGAQNVPETDNNDEYEEPDLETEGLDVDSLADGFGMEITASESDIDENIDDSEHHMEEEPSQLQPIPEIPQSPHFKNCNSVQNRQYIRSKENNGAKVFRILHTGDFRVCRNILQHPLLSTQKIDKLYLDTTYLDPRYSFPEQETVVKQCGEFVTELLSGRFYKRLHCSMNREGESSRKLYFQKRITDFFSAIAKPMQPRKKRKTEIKEEKEEELKVEDDAKGQVADSKGLDPPIVIDLEASDNDEDSVIDDAIKHNYLICIGTYTIGKEKVAMELAQRLKMKIFANYSKREVLQTYDRDFLPYEDLITDDPFATNIHLVPMRHISSLSALEQYYSPLKVTFKNIIGIRPTGWTLRGKPSFSARELRELSKHEILARSIEHKMTFGVDSFLAQYNSNKVVQVYEIPYSEHSSFRELCMLIVLLNVDQVIPTVNLHNPETIRMMEEWFTACKQLKEVKSYRIENF